MPVYAKQLLRRERGYAPVPVSVAAEGVAPAEGIIFAAGPEQKNTFTLLRGTDGFVSQHIGDVENAETYDAWLATKDRFESLFEMTPTAVACDLHPEYLTSKWAHHQGFPVTEVQHHHAHIVSVMGEHGLPGPVCGIAFDGTGYGVDGAIWGGEVLLSNLTTFERFINVAYFPLPGGTQELHHTDRCAYGVLWAFDLLEHPFAQAFFADQEQETELMTKMIEGGINTPFTSSMGRLFDAASALLGICNEPRYEGEGAILLEAEITKGFGTDAAAELKTLLAEAEKTTSSLAQEAADPTAELDAVERYQFGLIKNTATEQSTAQDTSVLLLDPAPVFEALLDDLQAGVDKALIARRFHEAVVRAILTAAETVRALYDINIVTLSGGVFMNRYLTERALSDLQAAGFTIALNRELPPNDASVSYGQAVIGLHSNEGGQ